MRVTLCVISFATYLLVGVSSRAVNISNSWMLPEEGFPVFYRYFRDRISWNEADAVCQFHHANLVTVDTTFRYDAIRAYLKELDITLNVWIGLSRESDKNTFTWRDFHELSDPEYWQESIPDGGESLCAVMDPAADFRWHALACSGPEVASFICELPVPTWATGPDGCLVTELPSLTALYMPEQSAVELTSDCGLDGTRRVICKGKADREEMIRQLACSDENVSLIEDKRQTSKLQQQLTTVRPIFVASSTTVTKVSEQVYSAIKTTNPWIWTSNTIDTEDFSLATRHRRETEDTLVPQSSRTTTEIPATVSISFERPSFSATETTNEPEIAPKATIETSSDDFSSVINQGQLFSILMNGTMFDIIDLNDTEENKTFAPDVTLMSRLWPCKNNTTPTFQDETTDTVDTTITNQLTKELLPEVPIIPSDELSRTYRKKISHVDSNIAKKYKSKDNNILESSEGHKTPIVTAIKSMETMAKFVIEELRENKPKDIKLTYVAATILQNEILNSSSSPLSVTTLTADHKNKNKLGLQRERIDSIETIAPTMNLANDVLNRQRDSEYESEPTAKPNRQRQLIRPNRRPFYPYFFSRVLG